MVVFIVSHMVCGIKLRVIRKEGIVKEPDMVCGLNFVVIVSVIESVEFPAQIAERARDPVFQILDLHLKVHDAVIIETDEDVEYEGFFRDMISDHDGVSDLKRIDKSGVLVEQGCERQVT